MNLEVLIIDDDEDIRDYTSEIMTEWKGLGGDINFNFTQAKDGLEGLNKLHEQPYDLAIVDMKMPKIQGAQLIEVLRSNPGLNQDVPIIVVSGFPQAYLDEMKASDWTNVFTVDKPLEAKKFHRSITFAVALKMKKAG